MTNVTDSSPNIAHSDLEPTHSTGAIHMIRSLTTAVAPALLAVAIAAGSVGAADANATGYDDGPNHESHHGVSHHRTPVRHRQRRRRSSHRVSFARTSAPQYMPGAARPNGTIVVRPGRAIHVRCPGSGISDLEVFQTRTGRRLLQSRDNAGPFWMTDGRYAKAGFESVNHDFFSWSDHSNLTLAVWCDDDTPALLRAWR